MKLQLLKVLGWVFVPYIMILIFWKKLDKRSRGFGVVWAAVVLLMVFTNKESETHETTPVKPVVAVAQQQTQEEKTKAEEIAKKEKEEKLKLEEEAKVKAAEVKLAEEEKNKVINQEAVLAFEKSAFDLEASVKPVFDNYQKIMKGVSEGKASIYDAYDATTKAREAAQKLQLKFSSLQVPDNLPKEVDKLLGEAKQDLSTAYYSKKKAYDAVLKFLDDQKPSNMQTFKEESSFADQFVLSGVAKLVDAKSKLGIDITKQ